MTSPAPRTTEDLRRELRRQAQATSTWPVPEIPPGPRPIRSRRRAVGIAVLAAALVAAALLLPGLVGLPGSRTDGPASAREPVAWEVEDGPCTGRPECVLPETVVVDGRHLTLAGSGVTEPLGAAQRSEDPDPAGVPDMDMRFPVDDARTPVHVLVGSTGGTDAELTVRLEGDTFGVAGSELPAMFEVRAPGRGVTAAVWQESRPASGGRLYVGFYEPLGPAD